MQRELFESSLGSGRTVLELLGHSTDDAHTSARRFRTHNVKLLEQIHPHYKDRAKMIAEVKLGRQQLAEQMALERQEQARPEAQEQNQT